MREMDEKFLKGEFNKASEEYGDYEEWRWKGTPGKRSEYERTRACIEYHLGKSRFKRALEIGCGPGTWTKLIKKKADKIDLVDISGSMLLRAKKALGSKGVKYIEGDFQKVNVSPGYDLVASFRALEYMEEKEKVVRKIHSLLKPGGRVIIITKNPKRELRKRLPLVGVVSKTPKLHTKQIGHVELSGLMKRAGFKKIEAYKVVIQPFLLFQTGIHVRLSDRLYRKGCDMEMKNKNLRFIESYLIKAVK